MLRQPCILSLFLSKFNTFNKHEYSYKILNDIYMDMIIKLEHSGLKMLMDGGWTPEPMVNYKLCTGELKLFSCLLGLANNTGETRKPCAV